VLGSEVSVSCLSESWVAIQNKIIVFYYSIGMAGCLEGYFRAELSVDSGN